MICEKGQAPILTSVNIGPSTKPLKMTRVGVRQEAVVINYTANYIAIVTDTLPVLHDKGFVVCLCKILELDKTTGFEDIGLITCAVARYGAEQGWKRNNVGARKDNP